jgi:hypothetical protein
MTARIVDIKNINPLQKEITDEIRKISDNLPEGRGLGKFQNMIQMELV